MLNMIIGLAMLVVTGALFGLGFWWAASKLKRA